MIGLHSSRGAERYTREREIEPIRRAFGGVIHVDPCSCETANRKIRCETFLTKNDNGLESSWRTVINGGETSTAWINPPSTKEGYVDEQGLRHHEPAVWWLRALRAVSDGEIDRFAFLFFTIESLRHIAGYDCAHPDDSQFRRLWLFERPIFDDEDGEPVKAKDGKKGSPAHAAIVVFGGDLSEVRWSELEGIGRLSR